jgi:hypothetical protein
MPDVYDLEFTDQSLTTYTMIRQAWLAINRYAEAKLAKARAKSIQKKKD